LLLETGCEEAKKLNGSYEQRMRPPIRLMT